MGLSRLPEPLAKFGPCLIASIIAGCAPYPGSTIPMRAVKPLFVAELPGKSPSVERTVIAPRVPSRLPAAEPAAPSPSPPSPVVLAMVRANSHYERGIQAMRDGKTDQAEWEFDAAFEALLNANLTGLPPKRLLDPPEPLASLPSVWLYQLATAPETSAPETSAPEAPENESSAEPDEPNLEAPALLGPEDLQAIAEAPAEETAPVPEPEAEKYDIPVVFNDQVKAFIDYFSTRKWGVVTRAFERARRYLPMMRQIFREKGLPEDLISLAFIESAVNPWATSKAKAAGIWQFIPSTGRLYGMRVGWWLDERRDPEKSTRGAAEYLKNLYQMFDSWPLALAAYNVGEGAMQRAIERQKTRDFWKLRLPKETQLFVPAFMAMTVISREPERYGFTPPPPEPHATETVTVSHPVDLRLLAKAARTTVEHVRELNPALIRWATPPDHSRFALRIPAGLKEEFEGHLAQVPPAERVSLIRHKIRKGDTTTAVAKKYGVGHQALLDMNGLSKRQHLKPGSMLLIPVGARSALPKMAADPPSPRQASAGATSTVADRKPQRHTVKPGDTLSGLAKSYKTSVKNLLRWNDLDKDAKLRPGQTLNVSGPTEPGTVSTTKTSPQKKAKPAGPKRPAIGQTR